MRYIRAAKAWAFIMTLAICCIDSYGIWMWIFAAITAIAFFMLILNMCRYSKSAEARERALAVEHERFKAAVEERLEVTRDGKRAS